MVRDWIVRSCFNIPRELPICLCNAFGSGRLNRKILSVSTYTTDDRGERLINRSSLNRASDVTVAAIAGCDSLLSCSPCIRCTKPPTDRIRQARPLGKSISVHVLTSESLSSPVDSQTLPVCPNLPYSEFIIRLQKSSSARS